MSYGTKLLHHQKWLGPCFWKLDRNRSVVKQAQNQDWQKITSIGTDSVDALGMRTFNQSLLQLVLKRKIEFKQGFEESPDPEELISY